MIIRNEIKLVRKKAIDQTASQPQAKKSTTPKRPKSRARFSTSTLAVYGGMFLLLLTIVTLGYQAPQSTAESSSFANAAVALDQTPIKSNPSQDEVVAATVAASIAKTVQLPMSPNIESLAKSIQIQSQIAQSVSEGSDSKVQLITSSDDARLTRIHTVAEGETLDTIAEKYGVSKDTVKWANNMSTNTVAVGKEIKILPTSGALYTVKAGDTIASLATKYKVSEARIILFNDLEIGGLQVGAEIVLPDADVPANERPGYVAPAVTRTYTSSRNSSTVQIVNGAWQRTPSQALRALIPGINSITTRSNGNPGVPGWCTWYAWERYYAINGKRLPGGTLGHAAWWSRVSGMRVSKVPSRGAIIHTTSGYYGHVGIVEEVGEENGVPYVIFSDMNGGGGLYEVALRKVVGKAAIESWNYLYY